jgi:hypothetical protein
MKRIIHFKKGNLEKDKYIHYTFGGFFYRHCCAAACGSIIEHQLATADTKGVSCKSCKRTKMYRKKICGDTFEQSVCHLEKGHDTPHADEYSEWGECPRYTDDTYN